MTAKKRRAKKLSFVLPVLVAAVTITTPVAFADTNDVLATGNMHAKVFAQAPSGLSSLDDISKLGDHIFVAYQNGIGAKGEPSTSGHTSSTIVEYAMNGHAMDRWNIIGKCDGLTADSVHGRIIATVNEDGNSSLYVIQLGAPKTKQVQHFDYNVNPTKLPTSSPLAWGGGTDSIAIMKGNMYLSASAPTPDQNGNFTHAGIVKATLEGKTASLEPVLMDNASATDITTGKTVTLNLSDADSSTVVPATSNHFADDLMLDSQGDSELVFVHNPGMSNQTVKRLPLGTQVDDVVWATSSTGTLYVTDGSSNTIYAISGHFTPNTVFVACPNDSGVAGFVGILDLTSGTIHPFAIGLDSPKGLLFVK